MMSRHNYAMQTDPGQNPNFRRRWSEPTHLHEATGRVVDQTARQAVMHWLGQAMDLDGEDRAAALEVADEIRRESGLAWGDVLDHKQVA